MNISFTDIARLSAAMTTNETLVVNEQGKVGRLGLREVTKGLPQGTRVLGREDFLAALKRATSEGFVEKLSAVIDPGTPLSARTIKTVVEQSKAEIETESHLRNLTSGLKAKADQAASGDLFNGLLSELLGDKTAAKVFQIAVDVPTSTAFNAARRELADAKRALGEGHDPVLVSKLAQAEVDLATAVHDLVQKMRMQGANLSTGALNVLDCLDGYATEMELNGVHLDNLAASFQLLNEAERIDAHAELDRLLGRLGEQNAPRPAPETDEAIAAFKEKARPFLAALAQLDTSDPAANSQPLLNAITLAYDSAAEGLEQLKTTPGLDVRALKELEANLAALKARADSCTASVKAAMNRRLFENAMAKIDDCCAAAKDGFKKVMNHLAQPRVEPQVKAHLTLRAKALKDAFLDLDNLRRAILSVPEPERAAALLKALVDKTTPIGKALQAVQARLQKDAEKELMVSLGAQDIGPRLTRFQKSFEKGAYENPIEGLDARILGEVLRGEVDLLNYVSLKAADLPEEMLRSDLDVEHAKKAGHAGSGNFNSVDFVDLKNVRTGNETRYVVKNVELAQDQGAMQGVASVFSKQSHARNAAKLNYASWKGANLIGCGSSVTNSGVARIDGRYQLVQEVAEGKDLAAWRKPGESFNEKIQNYSDNVKRRIWRELQIATAKLEWADWLSGQLDRTIHNELMDFKVDDSDPTHPPRVTVCFKGIDNDASFPECRTGIYDFHVLGSDRNIVDTRHFTTRRIEGLLSNLGVRGLRRPVFLPKSVQLRLASLTPEQYAAEMAPYLSPEALNAAVARYTEMRNAAATWPKECIIDDSKTTGAMTDAEVKDEVTKLDTLYTSSYNALKNQIGEMFMSNVGGFYGYLIGLSH